MVNALFGKGREGFLDGSIDWETGTIKVAAVRGTAPGANIDVWSTVNDFTTGGGILHGSATASVALASKTVALGVADALDITFTALTATGAAPCSLLIYQSSAASGGGDVAANLQRLIAYIDTGTNIPFTPNGGDVTVAWDNTAAVKIFKL